MYTYKATVIRWVDGDTVLVLIDVGFKIRHELTVRVYGIDTPELRSSDPAEREKAAAALKFVLTKAPPGTVVTAKTSKPYKTDKYGRWVADFYLDDGSSLSNLLLAAELAQPFMTESVA